VVADLGEDPLRCRQVIVPHITVEDKTDPARHHHAAEQAGLVRGSDE
jgi:hypothetical protein